MSDNLRLVLGGIVLMLAGLFLLGICVLSGGNGFYPDFPAAICGAAGLVLAAVGTARGRTHITAFKRTIPQSTVANAGSIALLMLTLGAVGAGTIAVIDGVSFENAIYETISALCTVGLTTGITSGLSLASCLILIIFMFFGRVGIMTISVGFMMANPAEDRITYAQTRVMIG